MRQVSVCVYQFDELSDDAKKKAIENLRFVNVDEIYSGWADIIIDDFKANLRQAGFSPNKISYSGFGSQGDGASFTGQIVNLAEFCKKTGYKFPKVPAEEWDIRIERSDWHYCHAYTVEAIVTGYNSNADEVREAVAMERFLYDWEVERAQALYRELETEYYRLTSDKQVTETIRENGWEFFANGKMYQ